jgi:hypothetical protein
VRTWQALLGGGCLLTAAGLLGWLYLGWYAKRWHRRCGGAWVWKKIVVRYDKYDERGPTFWHVHECQRCGATERRTSKRT